jgi:hypothetical protein
MRALLATLVITAIAALAAVSSAAAAPPNFNAAESLCTAQGGVFQAPSDPTPPSQYLCVKTDRFSDAEVKPQIALCYKVYGGFLLVIREFDIDFAFCIFMV